MADVWPDAQSGPRTQTPPPTTGEPAVDDALLGLAGLASVPVAGHPDRLARAHERLHATLHRDGS